MRPIISYPDITCVNKEDDASCDRFEKQGYCNDTHVEYMKTHCKKSCGYCIGT